MKRRKPQHTVSAVIRGKTVELPAEYVAEFKASVEAWMQSIAGHGELPPQSPPGQAAILPFQKPRR